MNKSLSKLFQIASKKERKIIGLMSGTSMDGLDIALCSFKGSGIETELTLLNFTTVSYDADFRAAIKSVFAKCNADLQKVCLLNELIGIKHAQMILNTLEKWSIKPAEIDLIASHGQTIFHAPKRLHDIKAYPNATLQIGDGDHIAVKTGIITLCDFRQKHLAAGGEGAPLAVYGDYILFSKQQEGRILLNIGGIANLTYLPANGLASQVYSTDVGPGNTLMDQFVQQHYSGLYFDQDAAIAKKGSINQALLAQLLNHSFFKASFPKTTGPELFNLSYLHSAQQRSSTIQLSPEDILATLCYFSASAIIEALKNCFEDIAPLPVYVSGGGVHNSLLIAHLKKAFPSCLFETTNNLGMPPEAKEAILFAVLANECIASHQPVYFGNNHLSSIPTIHMGKICLP